jgi:hypothetical protein
MAESDKFKKRWPHLQRDCGGAVLELIHTDKAKEVSLESIDFTKDSLFCEWCYVIDLDQQTFEIFKGFNTEPLKANERFYFDGYSGPKEHDERDKDHKPTGEKYAYYPVCFLKKYPLAKLPTLAKFLKDFNDKDDE